MTVTKNRHRIRWIDAGKEPESPPNQAYPNGIDVDLSTPDADACAVNLKYPARRVGRYEIECAECGGRYVVTTAGRPDDPRSVTIPCRQKALQRQDLRPLALPFLKRDRTDDEIGAEIKDLVRRFGLHSSWVVFGQRCCSLEDLDDAVRREVRERRSNSTGMIITTGQGASPAGVFLPAAIKQR